MEYNGRQLQVGNGMPITPKKILRALCQDGEARGSIHKGGQFHESWEVAEGELKDKKEYYQSFSELSGMNPDVILINSRKELCFLYGI